MQEMPVRQCTRRRLENHSSGVAKYTKKYVALYTHPFTITIRPSF